MNWFCLNWNFKIYFALDLFCIKSYVTITSGIEMNYIFVGDIHGKFDLVKQGDFGVGFPNYQKPSIQK